MNPPPNAVKNLPSVQWMTTIGAIAVLVAAVVAAEYADAVVLTAIELDALAGADIPALHACGGGGMEVEVEVG